MHVAIIMDGNGRWATARGLARSAGHRAGADAVDTIVTAAATAGVDTLTLFAFSSDNWRRPISEVTALFQLLRRYLSTQTGRCAEQSIRLNFIGRRDRLPAGLRRGMERAEHRTRDGRRMQLRIAVDYSARYSLFSAAKRLCTVNSGDIEQFNATLAAIDHSIAPATDVDLLIRTGGEKRLSDFLLWECAYAELYFCDTCWPDFDAAALQQAMREFGRRTRRFGALPLLREAAHA